MKKNTIPQKLRDKKILRSRLNSLNKLGVDYQIIFKEGNNYYFRLIYKKQVVYVKNAQFFNLLDKPSAHFVENKELVKKALGQKKIKVPSGIITADFSKLSKALRQKKIKYPLVIKPITSVGGKGVTANIINKEDLLKAFSVARKNSHKKAPIIIEEYFPGQEYRLLILKGKFIACAERVRPQVKGDGQNSLEKLISQQVKVKGYGKDRFLFDWEVKRNLKKQKVTLKSIIPKNKIIYLRENTNMSTGGLSVERTPEVCAKFKKIAEICAKEFDVQLCGVDIITSDIGDPQADYRVIELNHNPGYHTVHITPDIGKSVDVNQKIIKAIFKINDQTTS